MSKEQKIVPAPNKDFLTSLRGIGFSVDLGSNTVGIFGEGNDHFIAVGREEQNNDGNHTTLVSLDIFGFNSDLRQSPVTNKTFLFMKIIGYLEEQSGVKVDGIELILRAGTDGNYETLKERGFSATSLAKMCIVGGFVHLDPDNIVETTVNRNSQLSCVILRDTDN